MNTKEPRLHTPERSDVFLWIPRYDIYMNLLWGKATKWRFNGRVEYTKRTDLPALNRNYSFGTAEEIPEGARLCKICRRKIEKMIKEKERL